MLVLSRQRDEEIFIGENVSIRVIEIRGDKVRLGIEAPKDVSIRRAEIEAFHVPPAQRGEAHSGEGI